METLLALAGCILGYLGWRASRRALAEIAVLRAAIAAQGAAVPEAPQPLPAEPPPSPWAEPAAVAVDAEAPPAPAAPEPPVRRPIDIEQLLTQRWGIWIGAVALLLAGVFLVRTAVEQGWIGTGPAARCGAGAALGLALIGGALLLRRRPSPTMPLADQAPAALAAGGVAVLFAAAYGAGPMYELVPELAGFVLLAVSGLAGLALALLFGPIVAAVGLVAAFATPALVQTDDPSLPGLFAYLFVISAACWAVVRLTAWTWLGWGAALGGAGWVVLSALPAGSVAWAPGLFVPAAAGLALALLPGAALDHAVGRRFAWAPMVMLGVAGLVLESVTGDPWARFGLLLLGPVAIAKAWVEPRLAWLPMVGAGLSVVTLLAWAVPGWTPTDEAITIEGALQAVLPGAWAPEAIVPFLQAAAAVAVLHAAAGYWNERRSSAPLPWAALVGGVPVLVLAAAYLQVGRFQSRPAWALATAVLAAALVGLAGLAMRGGARQRAGVHAAGAVASLALGCAIVLDNEWLTVAVALMLPALAWIEGSAGLPQLRLVALVVASVVLARLVLNPWLPSYQFGTTLVLNGLLVAYGIPAVCFALASVLFRRRAEDRLVAVLEAGACLFTGLLLVLQVQHAAHAGVLQADEDPGFLEFAWWTSLLGGYAVVLLALVRRAPRRVLSVAARIAGGLALCGGVGLLFVNPAFTGEPIGRGLLVNALLPAYLLPAALAVMALRLGAKPQRLLGGYALLASLAWCSLEVRQAFHPGTPGLWNVAVEPAELWALSGAWFALAAALMAAGLFWALRPLRLASLALIALVVVKVFLVDMSGLEGLWRVLSFLGLGLGLIALGAFYRRFGARGMAGRDA